MGVAWRWVVRDWKTGVEDSREVRAVLDAHPADAYVSANRTCEMGLRQATGRPYESFIFLLEELTSGRDVPG